MQQAKFLLPVLLVMLFPFFAKSQCTFPVSVGADASMCRGTAQIVTATPLGGVAPFDVLWSVGAHSPSISVTNAGDYSVIVTDANGCVGKDTMSVSLKDTSVFTLEIRAGDTALYLSCNNKNVIVKAQPDGILPVANFTWSTGATSSQSINAYTPGLYGVTVTAVNGCESHKSIEVTKDTTPPQVSILPIPSTATFNCYNNQVILDAQSTTPSVTFTWNTGQTNTAIAALTAGVYTVTARNPEFGGGNGCTATAQATVKNGIPLVSLGADVTINTGQTALLTANVTRGAGTFNYNWSNGLGNTPSVSVALAGNYSVTVTDEIGCASIDTIKVTVVANSLIVNAGADATTCKNVAKTFTAAVSNGVAPYRYLWSNAATTPSVSVKNAGNYTVTVTDATGATGSDLVVLTNLDTSTFVLQIRPDTALFLSCNNKNLILKAQPDGLLPVSDFTWNTGATSLQFINVYETGTYSVTVTAANGCQSQNAVVVTRDTAAPNVSILPVPISANLNCNVPQVILDAISTTPGVTFSWNTGAAMNAIAVTTAGFYTVTARNPEFGGGNGCKSSKQIEVKNTSPSVNLGADRTISSGQSVVLTAALTNGIAPFSYAWSNGLGTAPSVSVASAGTFSVTVTDGNGCSATDAVVVTVNAACTLTPSISQVNGYCFGSNAGAIYVGYVTGGVAPYQYSFDGGSTFSSNPNKTNLAAGSYVVVVKDVNNCSAAQTVVITEGPKINFTATPTSTCNGNGSISISNVSGGTGAPYQYLITNLPAGHPYAGAWVTATVFNNLPPNTYFVKVRDAGSCSNQPPISIVVGSNAGILATIGGNSTVCFGSTTTLTATATGGLAPFTYYWIKPNASSATTPSLQGGVGNFFVTITDANGCTASTMKTVTGVVGVTAAITGNTALCTTTSTTLTATGFSGTPPYNFTWSTGKTGTTNNSASGVSVTVGAGNYCVTITDASGCSSTLCKTVTASTLAVAVVKQNNCASLLTTLTAAATYGLAPYSYNWSNGNTTNAVNVGAGTYAVTVTDAGGCTLVKNTTVTTPSVLRLTLDSTVNVKCNGGATGKIFTTLTGGSGAKTFSINNFATTQTGSNFSNLTVGTYTIQAKDANGCLSNTVSATLTEAASALSFSAEKLNVSCNGANNGAITVYANGGTAPLNYSSDNGANWQTASTLTGLAARSYTVRVRDANGCKSDNQTITLTQPTALSFVTIKDDPTCSNTNDGKISVRFVNGGNGKPYLYSKNDGATWQPDSVFSNLAPATYLIKVRDNYSCPSAVRTIVVAQPAVPTFATTVGNITCGLTANGIIAVTSVVGGVPPYQYTRGSNFQTSANFTGLTVGTYAVQVKDAKGCLSAVKSTNVGNDCTVPLPLVQLVPTQLIPVIIARTAPNPAVDELRLEVRSLDKRAQQFDFIDASGKPILSENRPLEAGFNRLSFDISTLPQGTYFIQTPNVPVGTGQPRVFIKM